MVLLSLQVLRVVAAIGQIGREKAQNAQRQNLNGKTGKIVKASPAFLIFPVFLFHSDCSLPTSGSAERPSVFICAICEICGELRMVRKTFGRTLFVMVRGWPTSGGQAAAATSEVF
ncbi:MAG: hypothetical protein ACKPB0_12835 [Opitutaceae bacterium]